MNDVSKSIIYGNIQISNKERFETFKLTIANWQQKTHLNMFIRVRGSFASDAIRFLKEFPKIESFEGSNFLQWRHQTYSDLSKIKCDYVFLYLEDQFLLGDQEFLTSILASMRRFNIDVLQYSWHQHYQSKIKLILKSAHSGDQNIYSVTVKEDSREHLYSDSLYMISLTSIFNKDFLERLLKDPRPIFRKYDARGPFDVEKNQKYKRNEPYVYGLPVREFAVCVDDEMGIAGSSAIARGLVGLSKTKRGLTHYTKLSPKYWLNFYRPSSLELTHPSTTAQSSIPWIIIKRFVEFINVIANTLEFFVFELRDRFFYFRRENKY